MEANTVLDDAPQGDAVFDPAVALDNLVSTLQHVEAVMASLQAFREYTLAVAARVAEVMADGGPGPGAAGVAGLGAVELAQRAVAAEIAAATRMSDRVVQRQMGQALELLGRFPGTFHALADGRISITHARVIQDAGTSLEDPETLAGFEAAVLPCAEKQAPNRLRRLAAREAEKAHPEALVVRHERAVAGRCVRVNPLPDGMAELAATLPAAVAYGIHDRLTQMAKKHTELAGKETGPAAALGTAASTAAGDSRTMDQLRADLFADLLLSGAPTGHDTPDRLLAAITARVDVTVPVLTLMGGKFSRSGKRRTKGLLSGASAELSGRHPIDPATAKHLAGKATAWNRVLTDPVSGAVLAVDRYRPGEDLKRLLSARDSRCRFPGCGIPTRDLDLDHTHDAARGGPTDTGNLAALCRRHHVLKHHSRWTVKQTGNGTLQWTSPTGRNYTDKPPTPATTTVGGPPGDTANKPPPF
ncbi:HNH endonuclease signature motif containing protein [Arthrobacter sp. SW1]|uniref:HNH endonuclease signature motif containing protein n=1 Tax=Arthrobacter sp. SW1 TaxID=1920889 RepID=UPI0009F27A0E|nr:HNH endonuclease signature motif containing protein [Arthrobacter sp. SW1]